MKATDPRFDSAVASYRNDQLNAYLDQPDFEPTYTCIECDEEKSEGGEVLDCDSLKVCPDCRKDGFICKGCGEFYKLGDSPDFCDLCGSTLTEIQKMALGG